MAYPKALKTKIDELVNDRKLTAQQVAEALNNSGVSKHGGKPWNTNDIYFRRSKAGKKKKSKAKPVRKKAAKKPFLNVNEQMVKEASALSDREVIKEIMLSNIKDEVKLILCIRIALDHVPK